jgi:hypothetical protein
MNEFSTLWWRLYRVALALLAWIAVDGVAWAGESEGGGGGDTLGAQRYLLSYFVVILSVGLGMLLVCRSARRRDRPRGLEPELSGPEFGKKGPGVPVITVGMRVDQVNKLLGKPKISRRGDDIYRELAQAGKLSEEDAAKEYSIYEHPAGRYEIVLLEKRVVEVKSQPKREEG